MNIHVLTTQLRKQNITTIYEIIWIPFPSLVYPPSYFPG